MESRVKFLGQPVHPRLVVFPLGLLLTAVIFDAIYLVQGHPNWAIAGYYMMGAGILGALVAAPVGALDWLRIPEGTRAKRIGAIHGLGNGVMLVLFVLSWFLRRDDPGAPGVLDMLLSGAGFGLSLLTAWLGSELVTRLGVGVQDGANLNAPNSIDATGHYYGGRRTKPTDRAA